MLFLVQGQDNFIAAIKKEKNGGWETNRNFQERENPLSY